MSNWKWSFTKFTADLPGLGSENLASYYLTRFPDSSGVIPVTIPFSSQRNLQFVSPAGEPCSDDWKTFQTWTSRFTVTLANPLISVRTTVQVIDRLGNNIVGMLSSQSASPPWLNIGTTGTKQISSSSGDLDDLPMKAEYRVRLAIEFARDNSMGSTAAEISFGDINNDTIEVPVPMANSQIVWDGNTLSFPNPLTGYDARRRTTRNLTFSHGGIPATSLRNLFDEVFVALERFTDETFRADLYAWWAWAARGKPYAFALDSTNKVDELFTTAVAAGGVFWNIGTTAGVNVGQRYLLRQVNGTNEEIIEVQAKGATSIIPTTNVKYSYAIGDIFRSRDYFPAVVSIDNDLPLTENPGITYTLNHRMREDQT